jgi:hypothetical protein
MSTRTTTETMHELNHLDVHRPQSLKRSRASSQSLLGSQDALSTFVGCAIGIAIFSHSAADVTPGLTIIFVLLLSLSTPLGIDSDRLSWSIEYGPVPSTLRSMIVWPVFLLTMCYLAQASYWGLVQALIYAIYYLSVENSSLARVAAGLVMLCYVVATAVVHYNALPQLPEPVSGLSAGFFLAQILLLAAASQEVARSSPRWQPARRVARYVLLAPLLVVIEMANKVGLVTEDEMSSEEE